MNTYQPKDPAVFEAPDAATNTQDVITYLLKRQAELSKRIRDMEALHDGANFLKPGRITLDGKPVPLNTKGLGQCGYVFPDQETRDGFIRDLAVKLHKEKLEAGLSRPESET